jgi:ribosome biogenesis GTPase
MDTFAPDPALPELGWRPFFEGQITDEERGRCRPVRVIAVHRGWVSVAGAGPEQLIPSRIPGGDAGENQPAAGDWLLIDRETKQPARLLRRASLFKRRAPGNGVRLQLIAANVDTLFIVASCNQDFNVARLERYLVLSREVGVRPVIVLTKADLTEQPQDFVDAARALQPGLPVHIVNARIPESVAALAAYCGEGETVALLGSSGVGKSTLVNSLRGSTSIATQAVRQDDGKGRHTTTVRELHRLDQGGWLMDTPGMRELQLSDSATGLAEVFDDIVELALTCRFTNCTHESEPGCAIRPALASGTITQVRLDRWRKLGTEDSANSAGADGRRIRTHSPGTKSRGAGKRK